MYVNVCEKFGNFHQTAKLNVQRLQAYLQAENHCEISSIMLMKYAHHPKPQGVFQNTNTQFLWGELSKRMEQHENINIPVYRVVRSKMFQ